MIYDYTYISRFFLGIYIIIKRQSSLLPSEKKRKKNQWTKLILGPSIGRHIAITSVKKKQQSVAWLHLNACIKSGFLKVKLGLFYDWPS